MGGAPVQAKEEDYGQAEEWGHIDVLTLIIEFSPPKSSRSRQGLPDLRNLQPVFKSGNCSGIHRVSGGE